MNDIAIGSDGSFWYITRHSCVFDTDCYVGNYIPLDINYMPMQNVYRDIDLFVFYSGE